jgi:hypothetical protein
MMSSHSALEDRAHRISEAIASIQKSIQLLESSGDIAPTGCCLVHYRARGSKKHYWYYKLQASEPIFPTKTGKMTRSKHLGASGTEAHIEALMQINRRNQLEALSRTLDSLMQCWSDLYENSKE